MGARSTARDAALQMLFALELSENGCDSVISDFWREFPGDPEDRAYADDITRGVAACLDELDTVIRQASEHWRLERMTRVDRNVLRLGSWELLKRDDVPRAVVIDEAVNVAKQYGSETSGAFINGVLDRIAENSGRKS